MFRRDQMANYSEANMQTDIVGNNNVVDNDMNGGMNEMPMSGGCCQNPINEAVRERCVHRTFVHEVPQV